MKRRDFFPGSRFLSRHNMTTAVESDVKTHSFLTAYQIGYHTGNNVDRLVLNEK